VPSVHEEGEKKETMKCRAKPTGRRKNERKEKQIKS